MSPSTERHILHVDMDAFYAAIEQRDNPEWRGKPVVVGASPEGRGVVATCSYEARKYGIRSAMPSREAGRRCPHAIFTPCNMPLYAAVSKQVYAIFECYTPLVEPISIDEAFLDVTGAVRIFGAPARIAEKIRADLRQKLGLTGSVGIAHNLFLAKLASDMRKPDGQTEVPKERAELLAFLAPLPIRCLWGVGPVSAGKMHKAGLKCVGDVQKADIGRLISLTGKAMAIRLSALSRGEDDRPLCPDWKEKSISREQTFLENVSDPAFLLGTLQELVDDVGRQVRETGQYANVARIKMRWADFRTITRQKTFDEPVRDDFTFREAARELFEQAFDERPLRLIGFGVAGFSGKGLRQGLLFDDPAPLRDKREQLCDAMDEVRRQLGRDSLILGMGEGEL